MKKLILLLLLAATILVASYYFLPNDPDPARVADVIKTPSPDSDAGTGPANKEFAPEPDPFVPSKSLAERVEVSGDLPSIPEDIATHYVLQPGSTLSRVGRKVGGQNTGRITIAAGDFYVLEDEVIGGSLTLNMDSISSVNTDDKIMIAEMRSEEWFDVEKYPQATFTIREIMPSSIIGVLDMKGVSEAIMFPAVVIIEDDTAILTADFSLDRTLWGIYGGIPMVSEYMDISFSLIFTSEQKTD